MIADIYLRYFHDGLLLFVQLCIFIHTFIHLAPRCIMIHCQTLDCSVIDSAEFQNRNAIHCTYSNFSQIVTSVSDFYCCIHIEQRDRVNVHDEMRWRERRGERENERKKCMDKIG